MTGPKPDKEKVNGIFLLARQRHKLRQAKDQTVLIHGLDAVQESVLAGVHLAFGAASLISVGMQKRLVENVSQAGEDIQSAQVDALLEDLDHLINSATVMVSTAGLNRRLHLLDSLEVLRRDLVLLERENQSGGSPGSMIAWWDGFAQQQLTSVCFDDCAQDLLDQKTYLDQLDGPASRLGRRRLFIDRWISKILEQWLPESIPISTKAGRGTKDEKLPQIAVLTVIGPELEAMKTALVMDENDRVSGGGFLYYEKNIQTDFNGLVTVQLHVLGAPGNTNAGIQTVKIFNSGVQFLILCGIAAGLKGSVKIGDVVVPLCVIDATVKVIQDDGSPGRPLITKPLPGVLQMNAAKKVDEDHWHEVFDRIAPIAIMIPSGKEQFYTEHVSTKPTLSEAAIFSDNLLLRTPQVLSDAKKNIHQQTKAGEMEAAGFTQACMSEYLPKPWFIVRGISDFGDDDKDDSFHAHAARAAAAYTAVYIKEVIHLNIFGNIHNEGVP